MALFTEIVTPAVTYKQPLGLFINNEFHSGIEGRVFEVLNPHDASVITSVCEATAKDVDIAVAAARAAFKGAWKTTTPAERGKMLIRLANLIDEHVDILTAIESLDNGKSLTAARADIEDSAGCIRYYGGWADKVVGQTIDTDPANFNYTRHEAIGVCGQIIPWNFPLLMWAWKIGPALATGNTVVMKVAENTPLSALYTAQLVTQAGFPPGVLNIIAGFGRTAGAAMASHMDIDRIAFTGSSLVGRQILKAAADSNLKKVTLELGGKSPNIVFPCADLDKAVKWVNFGAYNAHGQSCDAGSRVLVHKDIYGKFVEKLKEQALANNVGNPFSPDTFQGPVVSQIQFDRIMGYIEKGKGEGAKVEIGGERRGSKGYYIEPTIFSNVTPDMTIVKEEIFGPVCTVQKFDDEDDAIEIANSTVYGLAAGIHATNVNTILRVSREIKAGTIWVNNYGYLSHQAPFGGYKLSGIGRELGSYALETYTEIKTVRIYNGPAVSV
ncbi:hypothetical protein N7541_005028 [Penicillium brevicompactum]|uniref:aldehyde dehydrogenase (NAD(+)) n=1 Tax=Penicillium brevicompactum TaxID=5074 RepID=A0A9W9RE61_PENBR|nr:hypothetical protein N7541_005028 [Penicillium brevicompactum]